VANLPDKSGGSRGSGDLRASDTDRELVAEVLRHAASEGRLGMDELDERVSAAYRAKTRADLDQVSASHRERPLVTGPNCALTAR
jgi:hypothetical protein